MLLAVDVGNTQTVFGLYDGDQLGERWRIATEAQRTGDELGSLLGDFVDFDALEGICLSSTVPRLIPEYEQVAERWAKVPLLVIGPGVKTGIPIEHDAPREIGPDRIVNAVAAKERYGAPAIVVDFGTSTNFDVVSASGAYVGGVLAPGVEISMDALFARAARLVKIDYVEPPAGDRQVHRDCAPVRAHLRLRRPGRRHRRRDPRRARRRGSGDRDRGARRPDRTARTHDLARRPVPDARRAADRAGIATATRPEAQPPP